MKDGQGPFVRSADVAWDTMDTGVRRQVLCYGPDLMLVRVEFEAGAVGRLHHHPHRQATYVAAGEFEVTVGEEQQTLRAGDSFLAVADVPHGVRAVVPGTLVDCFTPAREDFITPRS
jgi:quercetin dioxygenase-like cupin family protein